MGRQWWHITWSTYGTWLPGDPRGFRARRHKIHSSGNYKNPPPPGEHAGLLAYSRRLMSKPEVVLDKELQRRALDAIIVKAREAGIPLAVLAVASTHVHALVGLDRATAERDVGRLKRHSSHQLRDVVPGKLWSAGFDPRSIWDDEHLWAVVDYILRHAQKEGAVVWWNGKEGGRGGGGGDPRIRRRRGRKRGGGKGGSSSA